MSSAVPSTLSMTKRVSAVRSATRRRGREPPPSLRVMGATGRRLSYRSR